MKKSKCPDGENKEKVILGQEVRLVICPPKRTERKRLKARKEISRKMVVAGRWVTAEILWLLEVDPLVF